MDLHINLLGHPTAHFNAEIHTIPLNKPTLLLLFLAARRSWVSRSELAYLFQPDEPEKKALTQLRALLHRAKPYPWANTVESNRTHMRWQVNTNLKDFQESLDQKNWQAAISHYNGKLLYGFSADKMPAYSAWLELERAELEQNWHAACKHHITELEQNGDLTNALKLLLPLRQQDSFDENLLQIHLRLLLQDHRYEEATQVYKTFCQNLKIELDAEPLDSTQAIIDSFTIKQERRFSQPQKKHNLPTQSTRFIGRIQELNKLTTQFQQDDCRLISLIGLGGSGKTRLALEFVRSQVGSFIDGVFFVPLAGILTEDALLSAMAEAIGFRFSGSDSFKKQLFAFLKQKELMLLLDNFEQLKHHALFIEELLANCPTLCLLVTSREALEIQSEWLFDIYGLPFPSTQDKPDDFDSVALFLSRAERVSPQLVKTKETLAHIADIARFVEGLPLALELAATWTRSLSCADIIQTLRTNVNILSSNVQNLPMRQRSIVTVFDTSMEQLSLHEQQVFIQLAIFEGGFDLEAAEKIAGAHLVLLLSLINRSLVRRNSQGRYSIHELLRQYLLAKQDSESVRILKNSYSRHYLQRISLNIRAMHGKKPQAVLSHLIKDLDNIRKAYKIAASNHDWSSLLESHMGLRALMSRTGRWYETVDMYENLLAILKQPTLNPEGLKLKICTELSLTFAEWFLKQNKYEMDKAYYLTLLNNETDSEMQIEILFHIAHYDETQGRFLEAEETYLNSLQKAKETGHTIWQGAILERLTDNPWLRGDYKLAVHYAREWLSLSERNQEATFIVEASLTLHNRLTMLGAPEAENDDLLQKAFGYKDEIDIRSQALIYQGLGLHNYYLKDYAASTTNLTESLKLFLQTSDKRTAALVAASLGGALKEEERFDEAVNAVQQSIDLFAFLTLQYGRLAEVARHRGDIPLAKTHLIDALDAYIGNPQPIFILLDAFICLALIHQAEDKQHLSLDLVTFVYNHQSTSAPQKTRIKELFGPLGNSSSYDNTSLEAIVIEKANLLKS